MRDRNPYLGKTGLDYCGQLANDYISKMISTDSDSGLMVSKFGTIELDNLLCYIVNRRGITIKDVLRSVRGEYSIFQDDAMYMLCKNAGFFPNDTTLMGKYYKIVKSDVKCIDILGSYIKSERFISNWFSNQCIRVDLEGYYAPFLWDNPWTYQLKGRKVLVVHPFTQSIEKQYDKREKLFDNPDVLPEFSDLILIKAVQSIADNEKKLEFKDWFEALDHMKKQIDAVEFDVALIGCGAYGMDLAAHVKRKGKIAIHLAGWTQMLFGIYGERWIKDQPQYAKFINKYWVRPMESERPNGANSVERGCYW